MKTPTLIVRLAGLYLIVQSSLTLIQVRKIKAMSGGMVTAQDQLVGDIWIYAIAGLVIGLLGTLFAGALARLLTFDAGRD